MTTPLAARVGRSFKARPSASIDAFLADFGKDDLIRFDLLSTP
jgi:hypothetical protein